MEDYYYYYCNNGSAVGGGGGGGATSTHVPAFGSWDWNSDLPFTQCFESARRARLLRHSYSESEDRDLYVTGDLYDSDVVTPAMIVLPRTRTKASKQQNDKEKQSWKGNDDEVMESEASPSLVSRPTSKPVDGDLYQISPYLLYSKSKKKGVLGFFSSCLLPTCVL